MLHRLSYLFALLLVIAACSRENIPEEWDGPVMELKIVCDESPETKADDEATAAADRAYHESQIDWADFYFYPGGNMAKGISLAIGSKEYVINASGVVTSEKTIDVSGSSKGSNIAKFALKYVGNPYVYGGTSLTNGADCSGFVMTVFSNFGIKLLRVANDQMNGPGSYAGSGYKQGVTVSISTSSLLPGDLLFYGSGNYASHVAIYIGNNRIAEACMSDDGKPGSTRWNNSITISSLTAKRYKGFKAGVFRYIGKPQATETTPE